MTHRRFIALAALVLVVGAGLRLAWLRADPPVRGSVGIVWHDEGAWVHNARNRALWGTWQTENDNWNPVFVAPVFTVLEYASFATFGVGTWQARVVPAASGLVAVVALMAGLSALAGRRAAVVGGLLLSVNYGFVMWNRAALMESTMTMWIVLAWAAYARAEGRAGWALLAGVATAAAWFTKAAAAFFIGALVLELLAAAWSRRGRQQAVLASVGLAVACVIAVVVFVWPHWTEYRFYNWQMSVTRKPEYALGAFIDRATWIPIVQSLFGRMWLELGAACLAVLSVIARWRTARPAERLLVFWVFVGLAELVVHDSGNERRYVMFIPALVALASLLVARADGPAVTAAAPIGTRRGPVGLLDVALLSASLVLAYLAVGSAVRSMLVDDVVAGRLSGAVRTSALVAVGLVLGLALRRGRVVSWLRSPRVGWSVVVPVMGLSVAGHLAQYGAWAATRDDTNYRAAVAISRRLAEGTLVQGKLANGLSLESRIRPLFVGNGFGNFDDRLRRDDARYILTYDLPRIGYESSDGSGLIQGILAAYPRQRIVDSFVVDETPVADRAVLIDKFPDGDAAHARD